MRNLLLTMLIIPGFSFASSINMNALKCKSLAINAATTLKQVQDNCIIKSQSKHDGMFEVEFTDDATQKKVKCDFASNTATAVVNGCREAGKL